MLYLLRLWFGVTEPVGRLAYAITGSGLLLFKYGVEALIIWTYSSVPYLPWHFLSPLMETRNQFLMPLAPWMGWAWFVWSLPFLWIAVSMTMRRAADAGESPWLGLGVLVPLLKWVLVLRFCFLPSAPAQHSVQEGPPAEPKPQPLDTVMGLGLGLASGALMLTVSVYGLASYGASLFVGTPLIMGAVASYWDNRASSRGYLAAAGLGGAAIILGNLALLFFALEGLICIFMALPLMLPLGALGGILGKAIADSTRRPPGELMAIVFLLPVLATAESWLVYANEREVMTAVEIDAPPEIVWQRVIDFPDLPPPSQWYFRWGIACPERARIIGQGVGAVRHCEFTTGTFVEPITVWEPGRRLAFDVTQQPAPMFELSPYRHVHPPHLDGYLRSTRGEFRLVALPGNRTRLEGHTWYQFEMFPQAYWTLWSDLLIHRIHERVLRHVKQLSESTALSRANPRPAVPAHISSNRSL